MAVSPSSEAFTNPVSPTLATRSVFTVKIAERDTSRTEPSLYLAVSWNCWLVLGPSTTFWGAM